MERILRLATWFGIPLALLAILELPNEAHVLPHSIKVWARWLRPVSAAGQWAVFSVVCSAFLLVALMPAVWSLVPATRRGMARSSRRLSKQLFAFLIDRRAAEPPLSAADPAEWHKRTNDYSRHMAATMGLYDERFHAKVVGLVERLRRHGISDQELDSYFEHPTNPLGIRSVATRLGAIAERLRRRD